MHLWQNPSHTDLQTYQSRRGKIRRLLGYLRPSHTVTSPSPGPPESQDIELTSNNKPVPTSTHCSPSSEEGRRSSYVFLRTPRIVGEQLLPDDIDPPEAWGLYFEQGFRVHHFFILVLFIYILASLAFAIYWCVNFGFIGPKTGSGAFGVSSWMIALVSLVTTVWFKWAD